MKSNGSKSTTTSSSIASYFKQPTQDKEESNQKRSNPSGSAERECHPFPSPPKKKLKTTENPSPQTHNSDHKMEKENKESMDCYHYSKVPRNNCSLSEQELNSIFENDSELLLNHLDTFESKLSKSRLVQNTSRTAATKNEDCKEFPSFLFVIRKINRIESKCLLELFLTRVENEQSYNEKRQTGDELDANNVTICNLHDSW
jgi:hypothetical protein